MRIIDEQKERANLVNLPQFLMSHGFDLKKVGKEYVWKEHDSLHIKDNGPGERGQWFRFSENKGGDNIGLLREYMDMSFIDAVEALTGEHIDRTYTPSHTYEPKPVQQTARELSLAEADNCRRVFAYLCKTRGLDYDMLSALVKKGVISQEEKTGNVLFKYFDTDGKVIGAEKVGTSTEHKFKGIATGSVGGHGFEVVRGTGEKAFFFESAIDMLSYLQMHSKELDNCRLVSMMGVKPSIVLDTMLRHNIAAENVFLCSDNDTAGNEFAQRLQEQYPDMKRIITPDTYKDWNDMLRGIPKVVEQETEKKEVDSMADLITYGNQMWHKTRILDVGFGNGYLETLIIQKSRCFITGIDISEDMVSKAAAANRRYVASGNMKFQLGDCCDLSFKDKSFDVVTTMNTIYFWSDTAKGMAEISRVLKDGGIFYNAVISKENLDKYFYTKNGFKKFTKDEYIELGKKAGFQRIRIKILGNNYGLLIVYMK